MKGKRGCSLKMAFLLHVLGFVVLLGGCLTPYWTIVKDKHTGEDVRYDGVLIWYNSTEKDWHFFDFNKLKDADSSDSMLYTTLTVSFALLSIFLEFFLVQAFAFTVYNASCGRSYSPDWLMIFSLLSGLAGITTIILNEKVKSFADINEHDMEMSYSSGLVIFFIAAAFLACFFTICDRAAENKK